MASPALSRHELFQVRQLSGQLARAAHELYILIGTIGSTNINSAAMQLIDRYPVIKLLGILSRLDPGAHSSLLRDEGRLAPHEIHNVMMLVARLDGNAELRRALARALPSWFLGETREQVLLSVLPHYAKSDLESWRKLERRLAPLRRLNLVEIWEMPSDDSTLESSLKLVDVVVVLVSPGLFAEEDTFQLTQKLLSLSAQGGPRIIPILLEPTDLGGTGLIRLKPLPMNAKPVSSWSNETEAWDDVARGIRRVIEQIAPGTGSLVMLSPPLVCVLHTSADGPMYDELCQHLKLMEQARLMRLWSPRDIAPGEVHGEQVERHMREADLLVLLLSARLLLAEDIVELARRRNSEQVQLILVQLRPLDLSLTPFAGQPVVPALPVSSFADHDEAWVQVASAIRAALPAQP